MKRFNVDVEEEEVEEEKRKKEKIDNRLFVLENLLYLLDKWSWCEELIWRIGVVNVGERVCIERRLGI